MKRTAALLLLAAVAVACDDSIAPVPNPTPIAAVSTRASVVVTPSGVEYTLRDLGSLGPYGWGEAYYVNNSGTVAGYSNSSDGGYHAFQWAAGTMTDLGTLGGTYSFPYAQSNSGLVVGWAYLAGNSYHHAFVASGGTMTDLGTAPDDFYSYATDVNDNGQVVGISYGNSYQSAMLWQNGTTTVLPDLGGGWAYPQAINASGGIVGYAGAPIYGNAHAVYWSNGVATDLGTLSSSAGDYSSANDINDAGQIVGYSSTDAGYYHAFIWQNGVMTDLGAPNSGYAYSWAGDINSQGNAAGYTYDPNNGEQHAAAWINGVRYDLGTLGGAYSYASSINDNNQVVGYAYNADGYHHTFLWENGVMTDLGTLPGGVYSFTQRKGAISNQGHVAGTAYDVDNLYHPGLWDPSPTVITVSVDIKPGSTPNSVNPKAKGVIPVAVLSSATFDATTIDVATVKFGPGKASEAHGNGHPEDVNGDGRVDMVLHFDTQASGITCGMTSAELTGKTTANKSIKGSDAVVTVSCK